MYLLMLLLPAFAGSVVTLASDRVRIVGTTSVLLCIISCVAGILAYPLLGELSSVSYVLPVGPAFGSYGVRLDGLSALMITLSSVVYLMVVIHMARSGYDNRFVGLSNVLFIACILAMCADTVILLLVSWELVSLSTFLMCTGEDEVYRWRYFTITHFGGLMIMTVFAALWYATGTDVLSQMGDVSAVVGSGIASAMILLLFVGFGTKLGIMPFHAWMPDLYSTAPVHSVALLSTVCSNVAILLLVKSSFVWIGLPGGLALPLIVLLFASVTAVWGAMESLIQTEPRRILAYSSMENMAMVIMCLVMAMIFSDSGFDRSLTIMILVAGILHTINHSFFKSLMILSVGTAEDCTGVKTMDRLGGLAKVLPALSLFALIGTLSMAAVPPMNGFVSEWLMIKTVISAGVGTSQISIVLPLIISALGICGMTAAVSYARLYGFMFLGRPRSEEACRPKKATWISLAPLAVLSTACIALGIFSIQFIEVIVGCICDTFGTTYVMQNIVSDSLDPIALTLILAGTCAVTYAIFRIFRKDTAEATTWDCGTELTEDMQYTSIGFTQPLVRVFHPIYGDSSEITDDAESETYRVRFVEPTITYILSPIGRGVKRISRAVNKIQTGNIQSYVAYILVTLIVILIGVRFL